MSGIVFDSWAWIEIFSNGAKARKIAAEAEKAAERLTTTANLYEVLCKITAAEGEKAAAEKRQFIKSYCRIVAIDEAVTERAVTIHEKEKLPAVDAFTLAAARLNGAKVLTGDPHFKGMKDVVLL